MEFVLGALVVIGVFVFWCDLTDSWNNLFRWKKTRKRQFARKLTKLQRR